MDPVGWTPETTLFLLKGQENSTFYTGKVVRIIMISD